LPHRPRREKEEKLALGQVSPEAPFRLLSLSPRNPNYKLDPWSGAGIPAFQETGKRADKTVTPQVELCGRFLFAGAAEGAELALLGGEKRPAPLLPIFDEARDRFIVALQLRDEPSDLAVADSQVISPRGLSTIDGEIRWHDVYSETNGENAFPQRYVVSEDRRPAARKVAATLRVAQLSA
jgi:hypothetical protein